MRVFVFLFLMLSLVGCAVGSGEFSCKGYPEHTACMDVEHVYQATNGQLKQAIHDSKLKKEQQKKIRIWLAPWQTPAGNQVSASYVDTDLSKQHDSLSSIEAIDSQYFNPIGDQ